MMCEAVKHGGEGIILETNSMGLQPDSAVDQPQDLSQVPQSLCASTFSSVKWGWIITEPIPQESAEGLHETVLIKHWKVKALVTQSCLTLCNPVDCSPPGSSIHGIFQARSGMPFPSPGHLPNPGIKPASPAPADGFFIF